MPCSTPSRSRSPASSVVCSSRSRPLTWPEVALGRWQGQHARGMVRRGAARRWRRLGGKAGGLGSCFIAPGTEQGWGLPLPCRTHSPLRSSGAGATGRPGRGSGWPRRPAARGSQEGWAVVVRGQEGQRCRGGRAAVQRVPRHAIQEPPLHGLARLAMQQRAASTTPHLADLQDLLPRALARKEHHKHRLLHALAGGGVSHRAHLHLGHSRGRAHRGRGLRGARGVPGRQRHGRPNRRWHATRMALAWHSSTGLATARSSRQGGQHPAQRVAQQATQAGAQSRLTGVNLRNMLPRVARNSRRSNAASFSTGMVPATNPSCTALGSKACALSSRGAPIPEAAPAPVGQTGGARGRGRGLRRRAGRGAWRGVGQRRQVQCTACNFATQTAHQHTLPAGEKD